MEDLAEVFKALGDITRLRIVELLRDRGETCICRIVPEMGIPQPTVSHHMAVLRNAGLVQRRRDGQMIFYRLCPGAAQAAADLLRSLDGAAVADPRLAADGSERLVPHGV